MKKYELNYLISPELTEEEIKNLQNKIVSDIQEQGGILIQEKPFLSKKLAYSVKKYSQAFLATTIFQLLPEKLIILEKIIKEEKEILRHLLLIKEEIKKTKDARFIKKPKIEKSGQPAEKEKKTKTGLKEIEKKLEEILSNNQ
jgi:small subunit ribosomal protein S6